MRMEAQWTAAQPRLSTHQIFAMALRPRRLRSSSLTLTGNVEETPRCAITPLLALSLDLITIRRLHSCSRSLLKTVSLCLAREFESKFGPSIPARELDIVVDWALAEFQ